MKNQKEQTEQEKKQRAKELAKWELQEKFERENAKELKKEEEDYAKFITALIMAESKKSTKNSN